MLDHIGVPVADIETSLRFYLRVFTPLGFTEAMRYETDELTVVGLAGADGFPHFWLNSRGEAAPDELHLAFTAPDRESVLAVHRAAQEAGAEVLHEPKEWPEYHPGYFAVFVRDPDGNNVEAVTHG